MLSGGLTQFCCGDPNASQIPYNIKAQGACALVEWVEEPKGYPVIHRLTFCGDEGWGWEREQQAMAKALSFVRDNSNLRFTASHWRFEADMELIRREKPLIERAFMWALETFLSVAQKIDQTF